MRNNLNNDISNRDSVESSTNTDSYVVLEREVFDQSGLVKEGVPSLNYDEVFDLVEAHSVIPYEGPRGVRALNEQFQGTCIGKVLQSFPKGEAIAARSLLLQIHLQVTEDFDETVLVDHRRVYRTIEGELYTDGHYHLGWQQAAIQYRHAAEQINQGFPVKDLDEVGVSFTPSITRPNEFLIIESRHDLFDAIIHTEPDKINSLVHEGVKMVFPPDGSGYFEVHQGQYRVVEVNGCGGWTERGILAFISTRWYDMGIRGFSAKEVGAFNRYKHGFLDITYPTSYFDKNIIFGEKDEVEIELGIMTALPDELPLPKKSSMTILFEGDPELSDTLPDHP